MSEEGRLSWSISTPHYDRISNKEREAVDCAIAAMLVSLAEQGIHLVVSGHVLRVANEVGRWISASQVEVSGPRVINLIKGDPDPGHAFMQWWRTGKARDPEEVRTGYFGHDTPLFDP